MDEDEKQDRFWDRMEGNAVGRKVLAVMDSLGDWYHRHTSRYYDRSQKRYRFLTRLTALAIVLVVAAVAAGIYRIGLDHYRHYQEGRLQAESQAFMARGDYVNAALTARQALAINPNNVPACRIMAELANHIHSPLTLDWLQRAVQNEPTVENKLILATAALDYQQPPYPLAVQMLDDLAPTASNSADYQAVAASLALHTYHLAEAEAHFEAAAKMEPSNELFQMSLAVLRMDSTNTAEQSQSREVLEKLRTDDNLGVLALRALIADRLLHQDAETAAGYSRQLVTNPHATLADNLQNLGILQQLKSGELDARLQTVEQQVTTNALDVAELSAWMQANGLLAENLDWLTGLPIPLLNERPVEMALAQGYLKDGNWQALQNRASQENWGDLEFLRLAFVFRAMSQLNQTAAAENSWGAAVGEAAGHREDLTQLLQLTESWHLEQKREALLLQMVQQFPDDQQARQDVEMSFFQSGNTLGLHQLYFILNAHFPDNTDYENDLAATSLLLKLDVTKACQWAAETYAREPDNPVEASTYAFALHVQGWDKQGLAVLQKLSPAQLAQPSVALYYGVLLAANGKTDQAQPWLQIAQTKGHLLPEEKQLLAEALGRAGPTQP